MSDRCERHSTESAATADPLSPDRCPGCGNKGKTVERITLMALLTLAARDQSSDCNYRFCAFVGCDIVYFGANETFSRDDVTVRVGQKESTPSRLVCYCFNHTVQSILDEIESTGRTTVVESITAEIKAGRCQCETRNPKGTCCLGDVAQAVKAATTTAIV